MSRLLTDEEVALLSELRTMSESVAGGAALLIEAGKYQPGNTFMKTFSEFLVKQRAAALQVENTLGINQAPEGVEEGIA